MVKQRSSNFELLRIVAMLFIISFHYVYKSGYVFDSLTIHSVIIKSFYFLGELGVNLFILITGYFQVKGKFSIEKLIKLILEVSFYYIFTFFIHNYIYIYIDGASFTYSIKKIFLLFFSFIFNSYWFITAYILLYILSPFLNKFVSKISQNDFKKLLLVLLSLYCAIPTVLGLLNNSTETLFYYSRFIWLIIIYLLGAYIRLYSLKFFSKKKNTILIAACSFTVMVIGIIIIYVFRDFFAKIGTTEVAYFWTPNSIPMLLLSVAIFELFKDIKLKYNKIINTLASTTLGIYLLHDSVLNKYIWKNIFRTLKCLNSKYYLLYILASSIIIFLVGAIIDLIRQLFERITIGKFFESNLYQKIKFKCQKMIHHILNCI